MYEICKQAAATSAIFLQINFLFRIAFVSNTFMFSKLYVFLYIDELRLFYVYTHEPFCCINTLNLSAYIHISVQALNAGRCSDFLKTIGLFCRISSLLQSSFAEETCNFKPHHACFICFTTCHAQYTFERTQHMPHIIYFTTHNTLLYVFSHTPQFTTCEHVLYMYIRIHIAHRIYI